MVRFVITAFFIGLSLITVATSYKRVCYFTNWATIRSGEGRFLPEDIDVTLCTHIIYAFAEISGTNLATTQYNDLDLYDRINRLKQRSRNPLRILLGVGGWAAGIDNFSNMVATDESIDEFVRSSVAFLKAMGFDGMDLDWEYPAHRGSPQSDRERFSVLVARLHTTFEQSGLILSAALCAGAAIASQAYEIAEISANLDLINLMTYDYYGGGWTQSTGHHTALHPESSNAVQFWIENGAPREKIMFGMAAYGRSFTLVDSTDNGLGAPIYDNGIAGVYLGIPGELAYSTICQYLNAGNWTRVWDATKDATYAINGDQWVGYDDLDSLAAKVQYVASEGLGGSMIWSMDLDDFHNRCGDGSFPLLRFLRDTLPTAEELASTEIPRTTSESSRNTTVLPLNRTKISFTDVAVSTNASFSGFQVVSCTKVGLWRDPDDCRVFTSCYEGVGLRLRCPEALLFNGIRCGLPAFANC